MPWQWKFKSDILQRKIIEGLFYCEIANTFVQFLHGTLKIILQLEIG